MNYKKKVLKNGLRIVAVPIKGAPSVTVMSLIEAGSKYENKQNNGISHFLEHMCFKGTDKRPKAIDISREFDSMGAQNNAFTSQEVTGYWAKAHNKHTDKILDIISDMYLHPTFPASDLETEKGVIVEEINMYEDLPRILVHEVLDELLYGDQPAGWNIAGTKENVRGFNRNDFINYRKDHYVSSATAIVIAGDIDEGDVFKKVEKTFAKIPMAKKVDKKKVLEKQNKPEAKVKFKETDQTHLVVGVRAFNLYDKKMPTLRLLSAVLGNGMSSRLFQKMREELGICYYIGSGINDFTDNGALVISAGVDSNRVERGIKGILDEMKRIKDEKVPESELRKAKDYLIGNTYLGLESSDSLARFYGFQEILKEKIKTPKDVEKEIEKVTAEDIQRVAKEIIQNKKLNLAIVGKYKDPSRFKNILKV
ncbi:MAG: pitrilysin family protein [Candidatus Zambryskibacteria bacterium]